MNLDLPNCTLRDVEIIWSGDFSQSSLGDVVGWKTQNAASAKQIRSDKQVAVNRRLSKQITFEEYQVISLDTLIGLAECERRRLTILHELSRRYQIGRKPLQGAPWKRDENGPSRVNVHLLQQVDKD